MLILTNVSASLTYAIILPVYFCQNVMHSFFCHVTKHLLKYPWHTELPLHQVTHEHHQVLAESLEHEKIVLYIVHIAAVALDRTINLLEESFRQTINIHQHLAAACTLCDTKFVILRRNFQCAFEYSQIRQEVNVTDTQLSCHYCLIIHTNQRHEVFHSAHTYRFISTFCCFLA